MTLVVMPDEYQSIRITALARHVEDYARAKPLKTAAIVGALAFLFGLTG